MALKRVAFGDRGKGEGEKIRNRWEREGSGTRCRHHHLKPGTEAFDASNLDVRVWHMEGRRSVSIQLGGVKDRDRSKVQFHRVSSNYITIWERWGTRFAMADIRLQRTGFAYWMLGRVLRRATPIAFHLSHQWRYNSPSDDARAHYRNTTLYRSDPSSTAATWRRNPD